MLNPINTWFLLFFQQNTGQVTLPPWSGVKIPSNHIWITLKQKKSKCPFKRRNYYCFQQLKKTLCKHIIKSAVVLFVFLNCPGKRLLTFTKWRQTQSTLQYSIPLSCGLLCICNCLTIAFYWLEKKYYIFCTTGRTYVINKLHWTGTLGKRQQSEIAPTITKT